MRLRRASPIVVLAFVIALVQGVGGALQKKGVALLHPQGGIGGIILAAASDPILVTGVMLNMILGGALLMIALSMGDGAKTGIFVGALSGAVFLAANVAINHERVGWMHLAGMACAVAGACLIGAAGLSAEGSGEEEKERGARPRPGGSISVLTRASSSSTPSARSRPRSGAPR